MNIYDKQRELNLKIIYITISKLIEPFQKFLNRTIILIKIN